MRFMNNKKLKSLLFCMMLIVAMAFTTVGCNTKKKDSAGQSEAVTQETTESTVEVLGEGKIMFLFTVVDKDGNKYVTGSGSFFKSFFRVLGTQIRMLQKLNILRCR